MHGRTVSSHMFCQGQFQHYRHAAPMLLFVRGNSHTRGNIWKFSVEGLQSCGPLRPRRGRGASLA